MRQITRDAVNAFRSRETFKRANTEVSINDDGTTCLLLHGKLIALLYAEGRQELEVSHAGWLTPTTKDRLNGLLSAVGCLGIYQKAGQWYWQDGTEFIDGWQEARQHESI
jgi:hypothetical protein